jgi:hypothetical protein
LNKYTGYIETLARLGIYADLPRGIPMFKNDHSPKQPCFHPVANKLNWPVWVQIRLEVFWMSEVREQSAFRALMRYVLVLGLVKFFKNANGKVMDH